MCSEQATIDSNRTQSAAMSLFHNLQRRRLHGSIESLFEHLTLSLPLAYYCNTQSDLYSLRLPPEDEIDAAAAAFHQASTQHNSVSPPFACAFPTASYCAAQSYNDNGQSEALQHLFAVTDEEGTLTLLNTRHRRQNNNATSNNQRMENRIVMRASLHRNAIFDHRFALSNSSIVSASGDQTCSVFRLESQQHTARLVFHSGSVKYIAPVNSESQILASCSRDGSVAIWDLRCAGTVRCRHAQPHQNAHAHHEQSAMSLLSAPIVRPVQVLSSVHCDSEQMLLAASSNATPRSQQQQRQQQSHLSNNNGNNGNNGNNANKKRKSMQSQSRSSLTHGPVQHSRSWHSGIAELTMGEERYSVTSLCWYSGAEYELATGGSRGGLKLWDLRTVSQQNQHSQQSQQSQQTQQSQQSRTNHKSNWDSIQPVRCLWPSTRRRENGGSDSASATTTNTRLYGITSLTCDARHQTLLASSTDHTLYSYDVAKLRLPQCTTSDDPMQGEDEDERTGLVRYKGHECSSFYVKASISPDGLTMATGSADGQVYIYKRPPQNKRLHHHSIAQSTHDDESSSKIVRASQLLTGHQHEVTCVGWSAQQLDGQSVLASCADDGSIRVWRQSANVQCQDEDERCVAKSATTTTTTSMRDSNDCQTGVVAQHSIASRLSYGFGHITPRHRQQQQFDALQSTAQQSATHDASMHNATKSNQVATIQQQQQRGVRRPLAPLVQSSLATQFGRRTVPFSAKSAASAAANKRNTTAAAAASPTLMTDDTAQVSKSHSRSVACAAASPASAPQPRTTRSQAQQVTQRINMSNNDDCNNSDNSSAASHDSQSSQVESADENCDSQQVEPTDAQSTRQRTNRPASNKENLAPGSPMQSNELQADAEHGSPVHSALKRYRTMTLFDFWQ